VPAAALAAFADAVGIAVAEATAVEVEVGVEVAVAVDVAAGGFGAASASVVAFGSSQPIAAIAAHTITLNNFFIVVSIVRAPRDCDVHR